MTTRAKTGVCSEPGCPELAVADGKCAGHQAARRQASDRRRPSSSARGYGPRWRQIRARYLRLHPTCVLCGAKSEVPDHHPLTRRQLVAAGYLDPDADHRLRPLCTSCHNAETARAEKAAA